MTQLDVLHLDLARSPATWAIAGQQWPWALDGLKTVVEAGQPLPPPARPTAPLDPAAVVGDWHRGQAIDANNHARSMLDRADRSPDDDEALVRAAYASAHHWTRATGGTPVNEVRSRYLIALALLAAGRRDAALAAAERCRALTFELGLDDFDLVYAHEITARALHAAGRTTEAAVEWKAALAVPVADPEDRAIVEADLAGGPGLSP